MPDHTNSPWDALVARGEPRGADAVLSAAVTAAEAGRDGVPVAEMSQRRPRPARRSRGRRTFGIIGIAALLGVGGYAIAGVQSNGTGADSPEAVVHHLADAIDHQDALAAVATLDPNEISSLQSSVSSAEHKAKQVKLVDSSDSPFAGINLSVDGLHTSVTTLASGVAKVTLSGSISASVEAGKLSEALQRLEGNSQGSINLDALGVPDGPPFVITVEHDGKWYISPAYTLFEYIRTTVGLPEADFGSADASKLGADTAPDAVVQLVRAMGAGDWNTVASLVPPDQFPLYEYRTAFSQLMVQAFGSGQLFTVNAIDAKAHADGTNTTVDVTAGGTSQGNNPETGAPETQRWQLVDGCINGGDDGSHITNSDRGVVEGAMYLSNLCLLDNGPLPIGSNAVTGGATHVGVVEEDGRWFVSPVFGTALDYVDSWIANFDDNDLASLVHDPLLAPVTGSLTLDRRVTVSQSPGDLFALPEYVHYTLHVDAPTDVVVDTSDQFGQISGEYVPLPGDVYGTSIFNANGTQLVPDSTYTRYHLSPGTYDVTTERLPYSTLTIWRAADAPKDVPTGQPGCGPTSDGGEECTSSSSSNNGTGTETYTETGPPVTVQVHRPDPGFKSSTRTTVTVP